MKTRERERDSRDSIVLMLLILLLGFICIILSSGWALRFAPSWKLPADMGSNLNPDSDFLTERPIGFLEPLDPAILTNAAWMDVFLTPGASFDTLVPPTKSPTSTATPLPPSTVTGTSIPVTSTPTSVIFIPPTRTRTPIPPTSGPAPTSTATSIIPPGPSSTNTPTFTATNTATNTSTFTPTATATATNTPTNPPILQADVAITKDDGVATYVQGSFTVYTVIVTNNGPGDVIGATVTDNIPSLATSWDWTCTTVISAAGCNGVTGSTSNFTDVIDIQSGGSIEYTVRANIHAFATGSLDNTASVTIPIIYTDPMPGNNSASDSDINQSGEPEVGPPDGNVLPIGFGSSVTLYLSQPIIANGDSAFDFVYYELLAPPGIDLDQIFIEISLDGATWYQVFFWGDNNPDTNSNVDNVNIPNISALCPTEVDNCSIPSGDLYNNTGISIDVDNSPLSAVPLGTYYWIRFTEPGLSPGDNAHVDAIEILP